MDARLVLRSGPGFLKEVAVGFAAFIGKVLVIGRYVERAATIGPMVRRDRT